MANLNEHDGLFFSSSKFSDFPKLLNEEYGFKIFSCDFAPFVSFTSRKAVLRTDIGTYFLKEKPQYCSGEVLRNSAAQFQSYLSTRLEIVPRILITKGGEFFIEWNDRFFFLTDFKEGRIFSGSETDLLQILAALNLLQETADKFETPIGNSESYDLLIPLKVVEIFSKSKEDMRCLTRATHILSELKGEYSEAEKGNYVMSHGDFSLFNIIFKNQSVVAINDFDNARKLPRTQDLAEFLVSATLVNYLAPLTNLKRPVFLTPSNKEFRLILEYYLTHFHLTDAEKSLLPILAELVWLDISLLAVAKEDYSIADISLVIEKLETRTLRNQIKEMIGILDH